MRGRFLTFAILLAISSIPQTPFAYDIYVPRIPNGSKFSCLTCHESGSFSRNGFGVAFASNGKAWNVTLALKDSDGDTYNNGVELQDPTGAWVQGQPNPGNSALVSNPGLSSSVPPTPTATPTPTVSPTASPTPSETPSPTPSATPSETPSPTPSPTETAVPTASPTPSPSETATPTLTPSPTGTASPTPTPAPTAVEFSFSDSTEGWVFVTASPPFTPPTSLPLPGTPGELGIGATNNTNTFGYWESPIIDVASLAAPLSPGTLNGSTGPGTLYTAQFTVRTSVTVPSQVPQMRLRTSPENLMQADFMVVDSRSDGVFSPTPGGRTYTLPFTPALAASRLMLEFEMLNFNPQDAATGDLLLDTAKLERRDLSFLSSATTEKTYSFALDAEGWTSQSAPPFTSPQFLAEPGALTIKGQLGSSTTFGFWTSPESDVLIDGTRMYIIIFTVESDVPAANRSQVPQFRVRVNETSLHGSAYEAVESKGTADRSPVAGEPQQYVVYFLPPDAATGQGLIESFDFLNFESTDKSDATLKLLGVTIQSVPKPF